MASQLNKQIAPCLSLAPLKTVSISIHATAPLLSPRLPSPLSPVESSPPHLLFSAVDEKRALAEQEMAAQLQADLEKHRRNLIDGGEEHSRLAVFATVFFYIVAAIVMVFANKWVLNVVAVPLTFLFFQLVIAVILLHLAAALGYFTLPALSMQTSRALSPLIAINVVGLTFNTYCLQYVDASFYQVARGLVLPFTVLASWIFLSSRPTMGVFVSVAIVCLGFFSGVGSEHLTVSPIGVVLGVFSSLTTSIHAIIVKRSLGITSSPVDLAYYNNLLSAIALLPPLLFSNEIPIVQRIFLESGDSLRTFIVGALVTGAFGFLICIAGFLSIKVTSPVTHMISSAVRGVIQTLLGMAVFGDVITWGRCSGIGFILAGSILYTWIKDRQASWSSNAKDRWERELEKDGSVCVGVCSGGMGGGAGGDRGGSECMEGLLSPTSSGSGSSGYPSPVLNVPILTPMRESMEEKKDKSKVY